MAKLYTPEGEIKDVFPMDNADKFTAQDLHAMLRESEIGITIKDALNDNQFNDKRLRLCYAKTGAGQRLCVAPFDRWKGPILIADVEELP